ncbi:MAG: SusE domain-containing protein [Bacteroidales bacterium]|nr:SusE domain-containing protein [Candidatus Liminaster caballi]
MKKYIFGAMLLALSLGFTACDDDNDSNPILKQPATDALVLNEPANNANVYDLETSKFVTLTIAKQPDYGYTAPVTYSAYMSIDGTNFQKLGTTSTKTTYQIPAAEINDAILAVIGDGDLSAPIPVQFYVTANLSVPAGLEDIKSNIITLNQVQAYVPVVEVSLPTDFYIVGSFPGSGWGTFVPLHGVYSAEGRFYGIVPLEKGSNFKFSLKPAWGTDMGYGATAMNMEEGLAAECTSSDDGNYVFNGETGLYTVFMTAKIANGAVIYNVTFKPAKIYLFGAAGAAEDNWSFQDSNLFTDNGDGTATSPVLGGSGELRMAVDCGVDWWKTEFTILNDTKELFYRNCDIPSNWAADCGDNYSFSVSAGQQVVLDFTTGTGSVK